MEDDPPRMAHHPAPILKAKLPMQMVERLPVLFNLALFAAT